MWEALRERPEAEHRLRTEMPLPDGRRAQVEVAMTGTIVDGRFAGAHGSVRDISARERLEGDLRDQAAELAASQERAHLARELHDSVTQALFSMGLTLRTLELLLATDPDGAHEKLAELRELQKDALAEMRTLIFELRPSSLENDGLVQALRTHATAVQRRTGLAMVVDAEPIDRLPLAAEEALYRIGQEALHNVVKHANASNATIRIWRDGGRVAALGHRRRRRLRSGHRPPRPPRPDRDAAAGRPGGWGAARREPRRPRHHDRGQCPGRRGRGAGNRADGLRIGGMT